MQYRSTEGSLSKQQIRTLSTAIQMQTTIEKRQAIALARSDKRVSLT